MELSPSFSTGGLPRPHGGSVSTGVSSTLRTKMPSLKSAGSSKASVLKGVVMPKGGSQSSAKMPKMASTKTPKSAGIKASSLSSALKSIVSGSKKLSGSRPGAAFGMPSAVGAPAAAPSPSFFGPAAPTPGAPGLGM